MSVKPRQGTRPKELESMVTLQISIVCNVTDERAKAAMPELLDTVAREFLLRSLLLSDHLPIGETMLRVGLNEPIRKKVLPDDTSG